MLNTTYTPGTPPTKPIKSNIPTYLNTPDIDIYSKNLQAFEINQQHKNAASYFDVKGFDIIIKGMSIIVTQGVCVLKRGQSVINYTHNNSKFFLDRQLPTQKTEIFYLAVNRTNDINGDAVLFLFSRESDIGVDWIVIKKLILPINSSSLEGLKITNIYPPEKIDIYNYVPTQPDGVNSKFILPFRIEPGSVKLSLDGHNFLDFEANCNREYCEINYLSIPAAGSKLIADFVLLY